MTAAQVERLQALEERFGEHAVEVVDPVSPTIEFVLQRAQGDEVTYLMDESAKLVSA